MRIILLTLLLALLGGCKSSPSKPVYERVADEVRMLIDSGYLQSPYVEIYEILSNDSSLIYTIGPSNSPASISAELPTRVLRYKDKYLCFIELYEKSMTRTELFEQGIVKDSMFSMNEISYYVENLWYLGMSKYSSDKTLMKYNPTSDNYCLNRFSRFWKYFSGEHPRKDLPAVILISHDLLLSDCTHSDIDSIRTSQIISVCGEIEINNNTDLAQVISFDSIRKPFYVVNGEDTLDLIIRNSFQTSIKVRPHDCEVLRYQSEPNDAFFRRIDSDDVWMSLYRILSNSTFCNMRINSVVHNIRLLHNDLTMKNYLLDKEGNAITYFFNKGVMNKEKRSQDFFFLKE